MSSLTGCDLIRKNNNCFARTVAGKGEQKKQATLKTYKCLLKLVFLAIATL